MSNLIDFFDQETDATNELKRNLRNLRDSIIYIQLNEGDFVLLTRAREHIQRLLNLISAVEQLRDSD